MKKAASTVLLLRVSRVRVMLAERALATSLQIARESTRVAEAAAAQEAARKTDASLAAQRLAEDPLCTCDGMIPWVEDTRAAAQSASMRLQSAQAQQAAAEASRIAAARKLATTRERGTYLKAQFARERVRNATLRDENATEDLAASRRSQT